ncbi:hypothetical protein T484DRAFT_1777399 [Baffinella frigidus]|nr:hypothetical protein T484DRAFT_1777399 [Cryptophyta sp. CCMP2293]
MAFVEGRISMLLVLLAIPMGLIFSSFAVVAGMAFVEGRISMLLVLLAIPMLLPSLT